MTDNDKIEKLRRGIMCAVIHLFKTDPQDIINVFSLDELDKIAGETDHLQNAKLEGIYKDLLDMTKPEEIKSDETDQ